MALAAVDAPTPAKLLPIHMLVASLQVDCFDLFTCLKNFIFNKHLFYFEITRGETDIFQDHIMKHFNAKLTSKKFNTLAFVLFF